MTKPKVITQMNYTTTKHEQSSNSRGYIYMFLNNDTTETHRCSWDLGHKISALAFFVLKTYVIFILEF